MKNYSKSFIGYIYQDKVGNILTASKDQAGEKLIKDYDHKDNSESWNISRYPVNFQNQKDAKHEIIKSNETMIFGILEDNNNTIWYGTLYGVKRITKHQISANSFLKQPWHSIRQTREIHEILR